MPANKKVPDAHPVLSKPKVDSLGRENRRLNRELGKVRDLHLEFIEEIRGRTKHRGLLNFCDSWENDNHKLLGSDPNANR